MKKDLLKTSLVGGETVKTDVRVAFFGTADELSCHIMELCHYIEDEMTQDYLFNIVQTLSRIMGKVAGAASDFGLKELNQVNTWIKEKKGLIHVENQFVMPGTTMVGAKVHIVRTIARRAELAYAHVYEKYGGDEYIFEYLNKISTLFYYIAQTYDQHVMKENVK